MRSGRGRAGHPADPFAALGLPAAPGLTDDDVRVAWRRVAAATHPDRADGGAPARFAEAAAAYTALRTPFGRAEALADLGAVGGGRRGSWRAWPRPRLGTRTQDTQGQGARAQGTQGQGTRAQGTRRGRAGRGDGSVTPGSTVPSSVAPGSVTPGSTIPGSAAPSSATPGRVTAGRGRLVAARFWSRVRRGRPARLALRVCAVAAVSGGTALIAGSAPATPALITGAVTWLALTARGDLAPSSNPPHISGRRRIRRVGTGGGR